MRQWVKCGLFIRFSAIYIYYPNACHIFCEFNTLSPRWNWQHFADDIFKRIFFKENIWISFKISLKFVPEGPINNTEVLVQIMTRRRPGDNPLSEPMMVSLPTHICVTRPQWVKIWFICYIRDHSGYGFSQWGTTLQCNVVSHWLSPYLEWSLYISQCRASCNIVLYLTLF